jgi:hypothetical protein
MNRIIRFIRPEFFGGFVSLNQTISSRGHGRRQPLRTVHPITAIRLLNRVAVALIAFHLVVPLFNEKYKGVQETL